MKEVIPVNVAVGVKTTEPVVVLTVTVPVEAGGTPDTVKVVGFIGPPVTWHVAQMEIGVFIPVVVCIGEATGGVPVTLIVINALVQETGNKLHIE